MSNRKRAGNRKNRRIAPEGYLKPDGIEALVSRVRYVGSAQHKLHPGDYGFVPPVNPRPTKSPCDLARSLLLDEARILFRRGIECGMHTQFENGSVPKYIWAVDENENVYEAKTKSGQETDYHGYRIGDDERDIRKYILMEWRRRCR